MASYTASSSNTLAATASITGHDLSDDRRSRRQHYSQRYRFQLHWRRHANIQSDDSDAGTPAAAGTIASQSVNVGDTTTVNLSTYFTGNVDSYSVTSSDVTKATAALNGPILTVTGIAAGNPTITVTATNNTNAIGTANQTFTVTVTSLVPMASGTPGNQSVTAGASTTVGVSGYFTGDVDSYSALSWNTAVATASMSSSNLTITGVAPGSTTIRVTATEHY